MASNPRVAVLCGGVGAGRFLTGLAEVVAPEAITAIVNVGDDERIYGLHVSPDIDTVIYALAGLFDDERGFGLRGDTFAWLETMARLGEEPWFRIGDRDLAMHVARTRRLEEGESLSQITQSLAAALGVHVSVLPATNDRLRTVVSTDAGDLAFQDYFVRHRWRPAVRAVRFEGADAARPAPGVLEAVETADAVLIAPSNPIISIAPILAVSGVREALARRRDRVVAVSPIVRGEAIKGPAAAMLASLGHRVDPVGVADLYRDVASALVFDRVDASLASEVEAVGLRAVIADTLMRDVTKRRALAEVALAAALD